MFEYKMIGTSIIHTNKNKKWKKIIVDITLQGLDMETRMKLLPAEQEGVKILEENGSILDSFIKLENPDIFMVMMAENSEDVHAKLSILPYYP